MSGNNDPDGQASQQYPFFFYGTLRRGQENYTLIRNYTVSELSAYVDNMALYAMGSFPMMVPGASPVYGELTTIFPHLYHFMLEKIDLLEGYRPYVNHCLYHRQLVSVQLDATSKPIQAWSYIGGQECLAPNASRVTEGDWVEYRNNLILQTRFARYITTTKPHNSELP